VLLMHSFPSVHCSRQTTLRLVSLYRNNSTFGDPWLTSVPARKCLHTIFLMAFLVVRMLPFLPRHTPLSCSYENLFPDRKCLHTIFLMAFLVARMLSFLLDILPYLAHTRICAGCVVCGAISFCCSDEEPQQERIDDAAGL